MATREIKTKLVLDGEAQYRQGLDASYKAISRLGKEINVASARYADSADAMERYSEKANLIKSAIKAQEDMIKSLAERLRYADEAYNGNTEAQELYAKKIKSSEQAIARLQKELKKTEDAMGGVGDETKDAGRAMDEAADDTKQMSTAARDAGKNVEKLSHGFTVLKGALSNLLSDAIKRGASALKGFVSDAINVASDMEEVDNVVSTAFKDQTAAVVEFANKASEQYGLSSLEAQNYAGKLGAALNALGLKDQAKEMSLTLTGLAGDLASFWNMTADETYSKVFAGVISGETEGLKSLGIVMTETNLQAYAMSEGIKKKYSAMTADEKAMLRYKYVLAMTAEAQGDFAKTSGSYANQMKVAQLNVNNLRNTLGSGLLPSVTKVIRKFNEWAGGDYASNIFESMGQKIGELTEGAFEKLLKVLEFCAKHIDGIGVALSALGSGIVAGKIAKLVASFAKMVTTLKTAGTAATLLGSGLGALPFAAAVAGATALIGAIINIDKNADTMRNKLKGLKFDVDGESTAAITEGINEGIEAADKLHTIEVKIDADTSSLKKQLDSIFDEDSPGGEKMTYKEYKAATKYVKEIVKPDIDEAKKLLQTEKEELSKSLQSLYDDEGNKFYNKKEADAIATKMTTDTQTMIDELNQAYTDYEALLKTIYRSGESPTADELAQLDSLLQKIAEVRMELQTMQDDALKAAEATTNLVTTGRTRDDRSVGVAIGYTQEQSERRIAEAEEAYTKAMANDQRLKENLERLGESTEDVDARMQETTEKYTAQVAAENEKLTEGMRAIYEGQAKANAEAQKAIESVARYRDYYIQLYDLVDSVDNKMAGQDWSTTINWMEENKDALMEMGAIDDETLQELKDNMVGDWGSEINTIMQEVLESIAAGGDEAALALEDNPLMNLLKQMLENGDIGEIDTTNLENAMGESIKALDWLTMGTNVRDGFLLGIDTATDGMTAADVDKVRDKLLEVLKTSLGIHSPAESMKPIGQNIVAGILEPLRTGDTGENSSMADVIAEFKNAVLDALESMPDDMTSIGQKAGNNIAMGIRSRVGAASSAGRSVASAAYNGANSYTGQFYSIGTAMMRGLANGIYAGQSGVVNAIISTVQAAIDAAKQELEINSPSRVFRWIGEMSAEGYALGIDDRLRMMEDTIHTRMASVATAPQTQRTDMQGGYAAGTAGGAGGNIIIYQTVNANETDYAAQQREAARSFANIARRL